VCVPSLARLEHTCSRPKWVTFTMCPLLACVGSTVVVDAIDSSGTSGESALRRFKALHVICTVPVSVLQSGRIAFTPSLPMRKQLAIGRVKMGMYKKVIFHFETAFWEKQGFTGPALHFAAPLSAPADCSASARSWSWFPLLVNYHHIKGVPILVCMMVGREVEPTLCMPAEEGWCCVLSTTLCRCLTSLCVPSCCCVVSATVATQTLDVLRLRFSDSMPSPIRTIVTNWEGDPCSLGGYSYAPRTYSDV